MQKCLLSACGALLVCGSACTAVASPIYPSPYPYTITDLGTLGGAESMASDINNSGQVVGWAQTASGAAHAFLYTPGSGMQDLGTLGGAHSGAGAISDTGLVVGSSDTGDPAHPRVAFLWSSQSGMQSLGTMGGSTSSAFGVNDAGQVVGSAFVNGADRAFLYAGGVMQDLDTLGGTRAEATAINSSGQVTGYATTALGVPRAFLWSQGGVMQDLGSLAGTYSYGDGINDAGDVIGYSGVSMQTNPYHAFLHNNGSMNDLGTLSGQTFSHARAINNHGDVVGVSGTLGGEAHAFLFSQNDAIQDLNNLIAPSLGWTLFSAQAINDHGQVTGYGRVGGVIHAYVLTPIPEPPAILLLAVAVACLVMFALARVTARSSAHVGCRSLRFQRTVGWVSPTNGGSQTPRSKASWLISTRTSTAPLRNPAGGNSKCWGESRKRKRSTES